MYDVVALGEILIDFTPVGKSDKGNFIFESNPGGAPANVLAALAKLGKKTGFIGKVGRDNFGMFLESVLNENEINTDGMLYSDSIKTTLAFVHLDDKGDRNFSFYRDPGADMMLNKEEIDEKLIEQCKIFHFGSVSMTDEPSKGATLQAIKLARALGKIISFDPNLRPALWKDINVAKNTIIDSLGYADILKISEEELEFITGSKDLVKGSELLSNKYGKMLIFITLGSEGCFYRRGNNCGKVPGYRVNSIDTTGAGDGFLGGMLYRILEMHKELDELSIGEIVEAIRFANGLGAYVTTKKGAISIMPEKHEVERLIATCL
jgi:fructokinase